jgi:hypothetical protein
MGGLKLIEGKLNLEQGPFTQDKHLNIPTLELDLFFWQIYLKRIHQTSNELLESRVGNLSSSRSNCL